MYKRQDIDFTIASLTGLQPVKLKQTTSLPLFPLEQLSEFYQVTASKEGASLARIIKIRTIGIPKERYKAIFKSVIRDRETFMKYVAYLLSDSWLLSSLEQMGTDRLGKGDVYKRQDESR